MVEVEAVGACEVEPAAHEKPKALGPERPELLQKLAQLPIRPVPLPDHGHADSAADESADHLGKGSPRRAAVSVADVADPRDHGTSMSPSRGLDAWA